MSEVGTLKELDVKPGDVVEFLYTHDEWVKGVIDKNEVAQMENGFTQEKAYSVTPHWRIVTRANTPKLWRDMTDVEKGALLLAYHNNKKCIDVWQFNQWDKCGNSTWKDDIAYRVRPEPKVETVTISGGQSKLSGNFFFGPKDCGEDTHRITFNIIDGNPDPKSIKMEAI